MKKLIPETIENKIPSNKFVYYFTWLLVAFNFFRSLEHIFNDDGGAQSIAGIPLDFYIPEASNNIISIFAQWGFSQLVLACILLLVVLKMIYEAFWLVCSNMPKRVRPQAGVQGRFSNGFGCFEKERMPLCGS